MATTQDLLYYENVESDAEFCMSFPGDNAFTLSNYQVLRKNPRWLP
jgi:hypothetical protein